jgi:hypothetical protein
MCGRESIAGVTTMDASPFVPDHSFAVPMALSFISILLGCRNNRKGCSRGGHIDTRVMKYLWRMRSSISEAAVMVCAIFQ